MFNLTVRYEAMTWTGLEQSHIPTYINWMWLDKAMPGIDRGGYTYARPGLVGEKVKPGPEWDLKADLYSCGILKDMD